MSQALTAITCIYCKQVGPPSREHILARSLSGSATAWIDCLACNQSRLSPLDQAVAERSLIALIRSALTPSSSFDVQVAGDHFLYDAERDLFAEVKVVNELRGVLYPQIHFKLATGAAIIVAESRDALSGLVGFLDKRVDAQDLETIHVKVGPSDRCTTTRLVLRRKGEGFLRVERAGDESRIWPMLYRAWPKLRSDILGDAIAVVAKIEQPSIEMNVSFRPDDTFRAVAKTAFNVLAADLGVELALRPEFDPIREYILGTDIRHADVTADDIAVDLRFVQQVPRGEAPLVPTDQHAVTITYQRPKLWAYVTLYGEHSFVVSLGTIDLPESVLVSREFSTVRQGSSALDMFALYDRLSRKR